MLAGIFLFGGVVMDEEEHVQVIWGKGILGDVFLLVKPVSGIGIEVYECYIIWSN